MNVIYYDYIQFRKPFKASDFGFIVTDSNEPFSHIDIYETTLHDTHTRRIAGSWRLLLLHTARNELAQGSIIFSTFTNHKSQSKAQNFPIQMQINRYWIIHTYIPTLMQALQNFPSRSTYSNDKMLTILC